jgi:hypothetical protein
MSGIVLLRERKDDGVVNRSERTDWPVSQARGHARHAVLGDGAARGRACVA